MKKLGTSALVVLAAVTLSSFTLGCKSEKKPAPAPQQPANPPAGGGTGGTGGGH